MKKHKWEIFIPIFLILLSAVIYFLHFTIFHDKHHLFIYGLGELAFVPLEVLLVSLVLHRLLEWREKKSLNSKINMLIGSYFSELGNEMLRELAVADISVKDKLKFLSIQTNWKECDFKKAERVIKHNLPKLDPTKIELQKLKETLIVKREYLSSLLQNPILLEHDSFADLLLATFHLLEELSYRTDIENLTNNDVKHLQGDLERAYQLLISEWICYVRHLKSHYKYLYSLAIRLNPLQREIDVTMR